MFRERGDEEPGSGLDGARGRALQLAIDLQRARTPDLTESLAADLQDAAAAITEFLNDTTRARDHAMIVGWSRAFEKDASFARAVAIALEHALERTARSAMQLDNELASVRDHALAIARAGTPYLRTSAAAFARDVDLARIRAFQTLALDFDAGAALRLVTALIVGLDARLAQNEAGQTMGHVPQRLVAAAVALLPAYHRDRYNEEFRAELTDLRRPEQLPYAVQVFLRCWQLRGALSKQDPEDD